MNGRLVNIDQRRTNFVARGGYVVAEDIRAPFLEGRMIVCVSYEFRARRVSVIDFFTNEGTSSFQREAGEMIKFRESLTRIGDDLCDSMPAVAARAI